MSEEQTLTYNVDTESVSAEDNLNESEQESLRIGEVMENQQENLLAGKYKNAEELEKAYTELEKKLGDTDSEEDSEEESEEEGEEEGEEEETEDDDFTLDNNIIDRIYEAGSNDELTEDLLDELNQTEPQELARLALEFKQQSIQNSPRSLTEQDTQELQNTIGGPEAYQNMMEWADANLPEQDIGMYDTVIQRGDPLACFFAIQALAARYQESIGRDGQMVTGKAPSSQGDVFNSQQEMIQAMEDNRYNDDPAYRQAVLEKLERSNIDF